MTEILLSSGFEHLETLKEFSSRFENSSKSVKNDDDDDVLITRVLICHKENPVKLTVSDLTEELDYSELRSVFNKRVSGMIESSELNVAQIFDIIFNRLDTHLATYILTKCYLFYNWGVNSIEIITESNEVHRKVKENEGKVLQVNSKVSTGTKCLPCNVKNNCDNKCFQRKSQKHVSLTSFRATIEGSKPFFNLPRNPTCPTQETFNLNGILYNEKVRTQWPANHILSTGDTSQLLKFIIDLPCRSNKRLDGMIRTQCRGWIQYRSLLKWFLTQHAVIEKNNGYGRILQKHLKNVSHSPGTLQPIPKTVISSYLFDIFRRVLPSELFNGSNHLRKCFFTSVNRIVAGSLNQTFMWQSACQILLKNKSALGWTAEMTGNDVRNLMIVKTVRFIVEHYAFVILRNNFYVTETGSSGYGLRFYRKTDMTQASRVCLNDLLYYGQVRPRRRRDRDVFTVERCWVDTGVVDDRDLVQRASRLMMTPDTEFRQPVAVVRFLPKNETTKEMRLITNMRKRRTEGGGSSLSAEAADAVGRFDMRLSQRKMKLFHTKLFLEHIIDRVGTGIEAGPQNPKLEAAWSKAIYLKKKFGRLYFVKADIADAFDSVLHGKLLEVVEERAHEVFSGKPAELKRVREWRMRHGKLRRECRTCFGCRPRENSILMECQGVQGATYSTSDFVDVIRQVATEQRVEIAGAVYKLTQGLAQGSAGRFSPQLCEIYYTSMDRRYFKGFVRCPDSILIRGVDDYLLLTSRQDRADLFLKIVRCGIRDFNARFNTSKLKTNLPGARVADDGDDDTVSYLGLVFNVGDMSVRPDYSRYTKRSLLSTMKLSDTANAVHFDKNGFFRGRLLRVTPLKLYPLVVGGSSCNVVAENLFRASVLQSLRAVVLAGYLFPGRGDNTEVIAKTLLTCCQVLKARCRSLPEDEVSWLFFLGAVRAFGKKPGRYGSLLLILRFHLERWERRLFTRRECGPCEYSKSVVADGGGKAVNDFINSIIGKPS